jgi:NADH dehydrogenase
VTESTEQKPNSVKHVVIVGGGFAGLNCARKLAANPHVRITLLDKNPSGMVHKAPTCPYRLM